MIWTKPDDFEFDEQNPLKGLVGLQPHGFLAGFCDGSMRFIDSSIDPHILKLLFIRNDGQMIDQNKL